MNQEVRTYYEMLIAIILQLIIYGIIGMVISGQYLLFLVSVFAGGGIAIGILRHMLRSIVVAVELDSDTAKKYGRRQAFKRLAFMGLALCVAFYFESYINPWGVLIGVMSLKFSAYLQPVIHKFIKSIYKKRREMSK